MAVLTTFVELLAHLSKLDNNNFLVDVKGKITFAELAQQATILAKKIIAKYGQNNYFIITAETSNLFIIKLLALSASGNLPIVISPNFEVNKLGLKKYLVFNEEEFKDTSFQDIALTNLNVETPALALLTSGSTGTAKVVVLSHKNIFSNIYSVIESMNLSKPDNLGVFLPVYHSFALITQILLTLVTGGCIYLPEKFSFPSQLIDFLKKHQINTIAGVPTNFKMLLMGNDLIFENIKHITIAGASLNPDFLKELKAAFPNAEIWIGYGLTEAGPRVTAINSSDPKFSTGTVGKAISKVEIKLQHKEILIKSPSIMLEYLNDKKNTSLKIKDAWLHSGDLGKIDENGYLYVLGRRDDIFISSGEKISPLLIEKVLNSHTAIQYSAIYGEANPIFGNKIIALVKIKEGYSVKTGELILYCKKNLENYLVPHAFFKVKDFPLTTNGKLKRKELYSWEKEKL